MKLRELGQEIGGADYAAVCVAIKRFEGRLRADKTLAQIVQQACVRLSKMTNVETELQFIQFIAVIAACVLARSLPEPSA